MKNTSEAKDLLSLCSQVAKSHFTRSPCLQDNTVGIRCQELLLHNTQQTDTTQWKDSTLRFVAECRETEHGDISITFPLQREPTPEVALLLSTMALQYFVKI